MNYLSDKGKARAFITRYVWDNPGHSSTHLAEEIAHYMDRDDWLDDETHWVWDLAIEFYTD